MFTAPPSFLTCQAQGWTWQAIAAAPGVTAAGIRAAIEARAPRRRDRGLLATFGIDLDEVRRRAVVATRSDDQDRWRLRRSLVRPLRVTLSGPAAGLPGPEHACPRAAR